MPKMHKNIELNLLTFSKIKYYLLLVLIATALGCNITTETERVSDFNSSWKFKLLDDSLAYRISYDDQNWRTLRVPHDWSVEASFDSIQGEGATGYLPGGIGWYRKHFKQTSTENQITYLYFDGVYNNAELWLNEKKLGSHPYGYSPFYFDITSYLNAGNQENTLAIKVDRSRYVDSRWYTGSGIYRNVKLITTNKLHIPVWGTFITTPEVSAEEATVLIAVKVKNAYKREQTFELQTEIYNQEGRQVKQEKEALTLSADEQATFEQNVVISQPILWSIDHPHNYTAVNTILQEGRVVDQYETPFGIRTIRFDPDEGFFLNGVNMKIKGVCLHHDAGLVGAAVPDGVWRRRLEKLKAAGCNAIRISHNPGSEDFLRLCDEMGFLVQDEFFDEWDNPKDKRLNMNERHDDYISRGYSEHFQEWAEQDLKHTMLAHRNHPSIFQWSIGNEIEWTYPRYANATGYFNMDWQGNYFWELPPISPSAIKQRYEESPKEKYTLAETAAKLEAWTREMDNTRPVVANCILPSASHITGYADALDIVGYSYRRVLYDYGHENYPEKVIMGTENLGQWHEWKSVMERPFISGTFLWTGIDYLGEANTQWPRKGIASGLLDLAGFEKPSYHMMKTLWNEDAHLYVSTQTLDQSIFQINDQDEVVEKKLGGWEKALWTWHSINEHWNYELGETIIVEIISNCPEVELWLNDQSLGKKKLTDFPDHIYKWAVPYTAGKLTAKGSKDGQTVTFDLNTAAEPAAIEVSVDRTELAADGCDVSHIVLQLVDAAGHPVRHTEKEVYFSFEGNLKPLGVDNGAIDNVQNFQADKIITSKGRALLIVQSTLEPGVGSIVIESDGLESISKTITIK